MYRFETERCREEPEREVLKTSLPFFHSGVCFDIEQVDCNNITSLLWHGVWLDTGLSFGRSTVAHEDKRDEFIFIAIHLNPPWLHVLRAVPYLSEE